MNPLSIVVLGIAATGAMLLLKRQSRPAGKADPERFILEATEGQWADIEAARLALKNSNSAEIQFFAQLIVDHNKELNNQLKALASDRGMQVPSKANLADIIKEKVLDLRSAKAFDTEYATQQPDIHEDRIALYRQATQLDDIDVANFARQGLKKMQEHLKMSKALVAHLKQTDEQSAQPGGHDPAPQNSSTPRVNPAIKTSSTAQVTGSDAHLSKGMPQQTRSGDGGNPGH